MKLPLPLNAALIASSFRLPGVTHVAASSSAAETGLDADLWFQQLLEAELAQLRRVIPAEEVLAQLDGTAGEYSAAGKPAAGVLSSLDRDALMDKLKQIANKYGVNEKLVEEVVRAESNFNPWATSKAGAKGLMQLMDATARALHVTNPYDPEQNLEGGTRYLRDLLTKYNGQVKVALAAYNAGPGRIDRLGINSDAQYEAKKNLLPEETRRYVAKIVSRLYD